MWHAAHAVQMEEIWQVFSAWYVFVQQLHAFWCVNHVIDLRYLVLQQTRTSVPSHTRPDNSATPQLPMPEIVMPDIHTIKEQHPELYKLIAGHLSFANATSDAAAVAAM